MAKEARISVNYKMIWEEFQYLSKPLTKCRKAWSGQIHTGKMSKIDAVKRVGHGNTQVKANVENPERAEDEPSITSKKHQITSNPL